MAKRNSYPRYQPPVYDPGIMETRRDSAGLFRAIAFASLGVLALFLVVGTTVLLAFGPTGLQIFLWACAVLAVLSFVLWMVKLGADIANRSTESAARVFMRQDIVDAYTDRYRQGSSNEIAPNMQIANPGRVQLPVSSEGELFADIPLSQPHETVRF